jgi:hypothetical protein
VVAAVGAPGSALSAGGGVGDSFVVLGAHVARVASRGRRRGSLL